MTLIQTGRAAAMLALCVSAAACGPAGGAFKGRVTYADGRPVQGMEVDVGGTNADAQSAGSSTTTDADGRYAIHMGPGRYHVTYGMLHVNYGGQAWTLGMDQTSGPTTDVDARGVIVSNFVVRTHGPVRGAPGNQDPNNYYGGAVDVGADVSTPWYGMGWPAGSRIQLTLTPTGPLIDGSQGKTLTLAQPTGHGPFVDIPVGEYVASVSLIQPGGGVVPLQGHVWPDSAEGPSMKIDFPPQNHAFSPNGGPNAGVSHMVVKPA